MNDDERLVNEKEAARLLGYSTFWFQQARCYGGGPPYIKIKNFAVRYRLGDLRAWLRQNSVEVRPKPAARPAKGGL